MRITLYEGIQEDCHGFENAPGSMAITSTVAKRKRGSSADMHWWTLPLYLTIQNLEFKSLPPPICPSVAVLLHPSFRLTPTSA